MLISTLMDYYSDSKQYDIAQEMYAEAIRVYTQFDIQFERKNAVDARFNSLTGLIQNCIHEKNNALAHSLLVDALEDARTEKQRHFQAVFLRMQASLEYSQENYSQVLTLLHEALDIFTDLEDKAEEASTFCRIADTCQELKRYDEAQKYYKWCLEVFLRLERPDSAGMIYHNWSVLYQNKEDFDTAIFLMTKAQEAYRQANNEEMVKKTKTAIQEWQEKLEEKANPKPEAESEEKEKEPDGKENETGVE